MSELESLQKMGLAGWPLVAAIGIVCISFVAWWNGRWPWTGLITKNYYGKRRRNEEEDED
jgi:hypothetical protein